MEHEKQRRDEATGRITSASKRPTHDTDNDIEKELVRNTLQG